MVDELQGDPMANAILQSAITLIDRLQKRNDALGAYHQIAIGLFERMGMNMLDTFVGKCDDWDLKNQPEFYEPRE